jgi:hypothetical protein
LVRQGETLDSFTIREITREDLVALVQLHVQTWNETYFSPKSAPDHTLREKQWREQFNLQQELWFCLVIENSRNELIGSSKGKRHTLHTGILDKIYILQNYQRLRLGPPISEGHRPPVPEYGNHPYGPFSVFPKTHPVIFMKRWEVKNCMQPMGNFMVDTSGQT